MRDTSSATRITPDIERVERVVAALRENKLEALLCSLPSYVLMLTGYCPVMANTVALFTADCGTHLVLPDDEVEIAARMSTTERTRFSPGSLDEITNSEKAIARPLTGLVRSLHLDRAHIGVELGGSLAPVSYLAQFHYGSVLREVVQTALPHATLRPADDLLKRLCSVKTQRELDGLRRSCNIAQAAYEAGSRSFTAGMTEPEAEALFRSAFAQSPSEGRPARCDAFVFCMSGVNSALAYSAYARTRARTICSGDLAMIHCNSNANGYWTDITRTYSCGKSDAKQTAMRTAILEARQAALARIIPGVAAAEVDKAARDVLTQHGYGENFKHATGHGVCFSAANHDAIPRIHPKSTDVLEIGMTFNIEPAIYIEGYGGMRHCDVVATSAQGAEVMTDFQNTAVELELGA